VVLELTQVLTEISSRGTGSKGDRWVGLTTFPHSCVDFLEILGASTSWNPQGLSRLVTGLLYLYVLGQPFSCYTCKEKNPNASAGN